MGGFASMVKKKNARMVICEKMDVVICDDERYFAEELERKLQTYAAFKDIKLETKTFYTTKTLKSYLANMEHIVKIRNYIATLRDGTELKVSERQYAQVKKQFLMWKGRVL